MSPADVAEVWSMLDRTSLERVARRGPPPVFATISGAHLYGFASRDSDVDLRGAFLLDARDVLGLGRPAETLSIAEPEPIDLDWVAHDLRKFARMMLQHNGYVLEQLYSPLVVVDTPLAAELRAIGRGCVTRPVVRHFQGFARGRRQRLAEPEPTVKHLLYAYRVYLAGVHVMRTGEIVSHLPTLEACVPVPEVGELVARKRAGREALPLAAEEIERHGRVLDRLEALLDDAHARSALPEEATTAGALEDLVIRARLATVRS